MIKSKENKESKVEIDLTSDQGNVFYLLGFAVKFAKKLNILTESNTYDPEAIKLDMMSGDYDHAVDVLEEHFGDFIILYR
jgi:hypothetical protein